MEKNRPLKIQVKFRKCIQDVHDIGHENQMTSRVYFSIDELPEEFQVVIRQNLGPEFNYKVEPLVVDDVPNKLHIVNVDDLQEAVEAYYPHCVGSGASGLRITGGKNISMRNNTFSMPLSKEIRATDRKALAG